MLRRTRRDGARERCDSVGAFPCSTTPCAVTRVSTKKRRRRRRRLVIIDDIRPNAERKRIVVLWFRACRDFGRIVFVVRIVRLPRVHFSRNPKTFSALIDRKLRTTRHQFGEVSRAQ